MIKLVLAGFAGLLVGFGLCVYSAPHYWFAHLGENSEVVVVGKEYEFDSYGAFKANFEKPEPEYFYSSPEYEEDLRFVKHDPIQFINAKDVELVCFNTTIKTVPNFRISIFLRSEAQDRFQAGIVRAEGHKVSLTYQGNLIDSFVLNPGAAAGYATVQEQTNGPGTANPFNRPADLSLGVGHRDNHLNLLTLAHYLSPDRVPGGCNEWFDPSLIEDWDELIKWVW